MRADISKAKKNNWDCKIQRGIVNEDNALPLCHVSCTISFGYLPTFCVRFEFAYFHMDFRAAATATLSMMPRMRHRSIGSALAILSVVMTMLMML